MISSCLKLSYELRVKLRTKLRFINTEESQWNQSRIPDLLKKVKALETKLKKKDFQINRLHHVQKELLSGRKFMDNNEVIYIVSTVDYSRQGIFKVGRTKGNMKFRTSSHNTTHIQGDKVKVLKEFKVCDSVLVERIIHSKLKGLLVHGEKEFFMCPHNQLEKVIQKIIDCDNQQNLLVNETVDHVFSIKQDEFDSEKWMKNIPIDLFM